MGCAREHCFPHETGCDAGNPDIATCPNYEAAKKQGERVEAEPTDTMRMPWTGRPMGGKDIGFLAARSRPTIVSVIGPHDAGKTTLLAAIFLAVFEAGEASEGDRFDGSYSMSGWNDVSGFLTLDADGISHFPPHTPDSDSRIPGLLHLAFSNSRSRNNLLFADAPGEWFTRWSVDPGAEGAKGAAWVTSNAGRNLLVADSAALAGPTRHSAREKFDRLVGRLADVTHATNSALVWTKSDIAVPDGMTNQIETSFRRHFGDAPIFRTQIPIEDGEIVQARPKALLEVLEWTLQAPASQSARFDRAHDSEDPFLAYGAMR